MDTLDPEKILPFEERITGEHHRVPSLLESALGKTQSFGNAINEWPGMPPELRQKEPLPGAREIVPVLAARLTWWQMHLVPVCIFMAGVFSTLLVIGFIEWLSAN